MKRVRVLVPFTDAVIGDIYKVNDEIELSDERIAEIKAVNVNMIEVIGEVTEEPAKKPRKKKVNP